MLTVGNLQHGGIMANYRCSAACRHCLYACSPERGDGYITEQTAREVCKLLLLGGCRSLHIGGGEPFLDFDGLIRLVETVVSAGINLEYIETNAFWAGNHEQAEGYLHELHLAGADTLCISLDPFHAEYIPPNLPISLAGICRRMGFGFFLWQERYLPALSRLGSGAREHHGMRESPSKAYSRAELERLISPDYIIETAKSYGLHLGGRAINIEVEYNKRKATADIADSRPCSGLLSGGHFHVDMHGRFVPPGCTGISIGLDEAVGGIPSGKYKVLEALLSGGPSALLRYAQAAGFSPEPQGYTSSCALCFYIRSWLCENAPSPELDAEHYRESMKFY